MTDHPHTSSTPTARERSLELEVARLKAEIDELRGEDSSSAASRLLAMAAETADKAVEQARREADEIVEEISSEAEARRDEATRVAAEAEAVAEAMLAKADRAEETVTEANERAEAIRSAAREEAASIASSERKKMAAEAAAFAEVRGALDEERVALETYHDTLRRKVQQLAETMISFMNTEVPSSLTAVLDDLVPAELEAVLDHEAGEPDTVFAETETETETESETETVLAESEAETDDIDDETITEIDGELDESDETEPQTDDAEPVVAADIDTETETVAEITTDTDAGTEAVAPSPFDPWTEMLDSAIPESDQIVDVPDSAIDEVPVGPSNFAGLTVVDEPHPEESVKPASAGLFARAHDPFETTVSEPRADETGTPESDTPESDTAESVTAESASSEAVTAEVTGFEDLAKEDETAKRSPKGLFGMFGARMVEQTSPEVLSEALNDEDTEDEAFQQFLAGDDEPDPSRDWLLRPEQH